MTPASASTLAVNDAATSGPDFSAAPATIWAGVATGSNMVRKRDGSPCKPAESANAQNPLVLSRWTITSRTVQPSQRLGVAHWPSVRPARRVATRRRWRSVGAPTAAGSPSIVSGWSVP